MQNRRLMSVAAISVAAAVSLTGCSHKDALDKAKGHAKALASSSHAQSLKSKGAAAAKSKYSELTGKSGDASGSASAGAADGSSAGAAGASGTVSLGKFGSNAKAKTAGEYFTDRQAGDKAALRKVATPRTFRAGRRYIAKNAGKNPAFSVNVTAVKGNRVLACVGPKGKTPKTIVVRKNRVAAIRKGTGTC